MKRYFLKINNKVLLYLEIVLSTICSSFFLFGKSDEELGLILDKNIQYLPLIISLIIIFIFILEFVHTRPYIRLAVLIISILTCILMNDSISSLNATICLQNLIHLILTLVKTIKKDTITISYKSKPSIKKTLPIGILTKKQNIISKLIFILPALVIFTEIIIVHNTSYMYLYIISGLLTFAIMIIVTFKTNPISKVFDSANKDLSFKNFLGLIQQYETSSSLHYETYNFLQIVKANYYFAYDIEEGIRIFETVKEPESKMYIDIYNVVKSEYFLNKKDLNGLISHLNEYKKQKTCNKQYVNQLNYLIDINLKNVQIQNVESIFPINKNKLRFQSLVNAFILMNYYDKNSDDNKAKFYAKIILNMNHDFKYYNDSANEILNK